jgi:hypothetical protein
MGIMPSPKMSAGNRELLSCLPEKYDLTANLRSNQLEGSLQRLGCQNLTRYGKVLP